MNEILLWTATAFLGAFLGCATGLLPGLHVNTLAVILVALAPAIAAAGGLLGLDAVTAIFVVAAFILAVSVSHTFVNIVPATYLGAPDESTALSILPAHRMLMQGHGYRAVRLGAYASFCAVLASLLLLWPMQWLLAGPPRLWEWIRDATPVLLVGLSMFLVAREPSLLGDEAWPDPLRRFLARGAATALFLASGVYGLLAFQLSYKGFVPLTPSPLLPMLGGLYGAATLVEALAENGRVPHQFLRLGGLRLTRRGSVAALGVGVAAGAGMALLPGLTNASATAVASVARKSNDAEVLVSLGSVNSANAVFNLVVLYLFERARSGAVVAMEQLIPIEPWMGVVPRALVAFFFVALLAAWLSLVATLTIGRWAARRVHRVPYRTLVLAVLAYVTLVALAFSGWTGLLVFGVGAALGFVPVRLGLQRTHLTGVLLIPILSYFWA